MQAATMRTLITGFLLVVSTQATHGVAQINTLQPFTTDGCSMMLDGLPGDLPHWRHCCVSHDWDYWLGGTAAERAQSDSRLEACIGYAASPMLGRFVHANVRWGGSPYWLTSYRWGYGWPYWDATKNQARGYKTLTDDERQQADALMAESQTRLLQELGRYE
jgi:hypothetical protein